MDVQPTLADEGARLDIRWNIREGPRTLVDHVLVTGNERTRDDLIRREIVLQPGSPLGDEALPRVSGVWRRWACSAASASPTSRIASPNRDVLIEVEESPSTTLDYGGGLEAGRRVRLADDGSGHAEERIEVAPRGFFEISRRNLWGKNRSISLFTRVSLRPRDPAVDSIDLADVGGYGFNEYRVVGTYPRAAPDSMRPAICTSPRSSSRRSVRASTSAVVVCARNMPGASARSSRSAGAMPSIRRGCSTRRSSPRSISCSIDRLFPQVRLSTLAGSLLRDSRNDVIDPVRGNVIGVDGSLALRALGSEVGFVKSFVQAFAYRRLPGAARLTLAAGVRLGFAVGFEQLVPRLDDDGLPIFDPGGRPSWPRSRMCQQANGSSPAATPRSAALSSIAWVPKRR